MKTLTSYGNLKAKSLAHTHLYNAQTRPVTDVSEVGVVFLMQVLQSATAVSHMC